mgnify:CR=1 FL=1
MKEKEIVFFDIVTGLATSYIRDRCEKKNIEWVRHSMQIAIDQYWILDKSEKEQEEFIDKQMEILDEMRTIVTVNRQMWNNNVSGIIESYMRKYLDWFIEFIEKADY